MLSKLSLSALKPSQKAKIIGFSEDHLPCKILEMGMLPGVAVQLKRQAPFNGPLQFEYGREKNSIILGEKEARSILIELI